MPSSMMVHASWVGALIRDLPASIRMQALTMARARLFSLVVPTLLRSTIVLLPTWMMAPAVTLDAWTVMRRTLIHARQFTLHASHIYLVAPTQKLIITTHMPTLTLGTAFMLAAWIQPEQISIQRPALTVEDALPSTLGAQILLQATITKFSPLMMAHARMPDALTHLHQTSTARLLSTMDRARVVAT